MKKFKKLSIGLWVTTAMAMLMTLTVSADMTSGLQSVKNSLMTELKTILDTVVIPLCLMGVVIVFVFNLVGFLKNRRDGEGFSKQITGMAVTVAIGILLGTWYVWGPVIMQ